MGTASSLTQSSHQEKFSSVPEKKRPMIISTRKTNKEIEKMIAKDKKREKSLMKILCLGTSCSGKSTILKQMRILHQDGFQSDEKSIYRDSFLRTFVISALELISKLPQSAFSPRIYEIENKLSELSNINARLIKNDSAVFTKVLAFFKTYEGEEILSTYGQGRQCGMFLMYFRERMEIVENYNEFTPNTEDILRVRVQTTGVVFTNFQYKRANFCMVDVGGQKTERKKWIHLFDDVKAIFFVVDLSNFEDMTESLQVFENICSTDALSDANMILFFNKTDIFKQKRNFWELARQFDDFNPDCSHKQAGSFIKNKFEKTFQKLHSEGLIYSFFTCATDTNNIDKTFSACSDIILKKSLSEAGLY